MKIYAEFGLMKAKKKNMEQNSNYFGFKIALVCQKVDTFFQKSQNSWEK